MRVLLDTNVILDYALERQPFLKDEPAQKALSILEQNNGNLEATFDTLWQEQFGIQDYGKGKSLLRLTLDEIRT